MRDACLLFVAIVMAARQDDPTLKDQGWPGSFPDVQGYQRTFRAPIVNKKDGDKKSAVYSQTVRYDWTGGRLEALEATLARDPAFEMKYDAARLKRAKDPPEAVKLGMFTAWHWKKGELVIVLGKDRILWIESKTEKFFNSDLPAFARRFDLARCAKALDAPPRTNSRGKE